MVILLSPSKTMVAGQVNSAYETTEPVLIEKANRISTILQTYNISQLSELLNISLALAKKAFELYQKFEHPDKMKHQSHTLFAFNGDSFKALQANKLRKIDHDFAREHLRILSALYGVLRPSDLIFPYRLDLENKLNIGRATNLTSYWKKDVTRLIKNDLKNKSDNYLLNLASVEYANCVDFKQLKAKVVSPLFLETAHGSPKVVSLFTKRARGRMTDFILRNQLTNPDDIVSFQEDGYHFDPHLSSSVRPVFVR